MYIEPNSTIKLLHNVPLDPTYDHTIYFENGNSQIAYFNSKVKYTFTRQTYQRLNRGYLRIDKPAEYLYDCNYLMFRNDRFNDSQQNIGRWFYAFIKSVEYINENVTQIEYELDVMQSWFFDYELDECFVVREHTDSDELWEHYVEEDINFGDEYVLNETHDVFDMSEMSLCALITRRAPGSGDESEPGSITNGIYTPLRIRTIELSEGATAIDEMLDEFQEDEIICVYQYPTFLGTQSTAYPRVDYKEISPQTTSVGGYVPKNKKLFCYPYSFLMVNNESGETATYRWEDWNYNSTHNVARFAITGVFITTPTVACIPMYYKGTLEYSYEESLIYSNFPQCAWAGDVFKAWWAQNKAAFVTSGISTVISTLFPAIASGIIPKITQSDSQTDPSTLIKAGTGIANKVLSDIGQAERVRNTPSQTHGHTQTDSLNTGLGRVGFYFYQMSIKGEYAKIVDDYFTRFGYACKRNKIPNRNVRQHWTYTQTSACTIYGSVPADDAVKICNIYNKGITFWRDGEEIGQYSLPNDPLV